MSLITPISEAVAHLHGSDPAAEPITVIGTDPIRSSFDQLCLQQALNTRDAPGVSRVVLNPDAHAGYGAPVGCVLSSPSHIYPGPVGVDIKCSMSLLQLNLPYDQLASREARRAVINALIERLPTGAGKGQRSVAKARHIDYALGKRAACEGASEWICDQLGIPRVWRDACEDAVHTGHDETCDSLRERFERHAAVKGEAFVHSKLQQMGSYGGGNHFGEANTVSILDEQREIAHHFGLRDGCIAFLSHCGSRGFGYYLAQSQFRSLQERFYARGTPFPGGDRELVYAQLGSPEANEYLDDLALGANFATLNHLLINALALEAFKEIFPGVQGDLVYFISHNIARKEVVDGSPEWVHRKGATRAFPAGHPALVGTRYASTGHPILLPGNPIAGSAVMVATPGAEKSCFSVNHGAGRAMSRSRAARELSQDEVDAQMLAADITSNCRRYPIDEAPEAYKNFDEVLRSVEKADLARCVARLSARFVLKDGDTSNGGVA
jgi:tRNA-splicing ligase RtcB